MTDEQMAETLGNLVTILNSHGEMLTGLTDVLAGLAGEVGRFADETQALGQGQHDANAEATGLLESIAASQLSVIEMLHSNAAANDLRRGVRKVPRSD